MACYQEAVGAKALQEELVCGAAQLSSQKVCDTVDPRSGKPAHPSACPWLRPPCSRRCGRLSQCWPDGCSETSPAGLRAEGKEKNLLWCWFKNHQASHPVGLAATTGRIQVSMLAPTMYPVTSKLSLMNFPCRMEKEEEEASAAGTRRRTEAQRDAVTLTNRDELSFLMVFAFPKASRMGFACSSCFSSSPYRSPQGQNSF